MQPTTKKLIAREWLRFVISLAIGLTIVPLILGIIDLIITKQVHSILPFYKALFSDREWWWLAWLFVLAPYIIYQFGRSVVWAVKTTRGSKERIKTKVFYVVKSGEWLLGVFEDRGGAQQQMDKFRDKYDDIVITELPVEPNSTPFDVIVDLIKSGNRMPGVRVYDAAGNVIETHEHAGEFKAP